MVQEIAIAQAIAGANSIREMALGFEPRGAQFKPDATPVTEIDIASAHRMLRIAREGLGSDVCVIDEELGPQGAESAEWLCYQDSCDGTTNLLFEPERVLPVAGVTYVRGGLTELCAVADPRIQRVLYGSRQGGVWLREIGGTGSPQKVVLTPLPPPARRVILFDALLNEHTRTPAGRMLTECGAHAQNLRTYGSCLLHLWLLATGRAHIVVIHSVSGFWDLGLHIACQSVGCRVTDLGGREITGPSVEASGAIPFVLATAPGVDHEALLDSARRAFGIDYTGFRGRAVCPA